MLNVENTRKVIAALRSGDHQQGTGQLEASDGKKCCLGVACRVAIADGVRVRVGTDTDGHLEFDSKSDLLPWSVQDWLGDVGPNPVLSIAPSAAAHIRLTISQIHCPEDATATSLNDDYRLTFDQIADCFEATLAQEAAV